MALVYADSWENIGSSATTPASINDSSVQHVNGLSVYQEGRGLDGEQGAFMVSAVVSATPREVFLVCSDTCLSFTLYQAGLLVIEHVYRDCHVQYHIVYA